VPATIKPSLKNEKKLFVVGIFEFKFFGLDLYKSKARYKRYA
tara:strand:- start:37 stop:162 length:126 start_codon:yes stop_codon:yes gene_type:complete